MKFYKPIDGLLGRRRRMRPVRFTFGLCSIAGLSVALYFWLSAYRDTEAEARTDRIISLSSPDFTNVLADEDRARAEESQREGRDERRSHRPGRISGEIEANQTLFISMRDTGVESSNIQNVVDSLVGVFNFRLSRPGDEWEVRLDSEGRILRFIYRVSAEEVYEAVRLYDGSYESGQVDVPTERILIGLGSTVTTSVYDAVSDVGEGSALANRFVEAFRWDFDFSRDSHPGDQFRILVERILLDGEFLRYGQVLAAEYLGQERQMRAIAFTDEEGRTEFYTTEGEPLRRRFLQAPLTYRRISSTFTLSRYHPVLQRYRPHLGVDYAAETGTPIWAIADGRVTFADERGGNGNLVIIEHADEYESLYAHLSGFGDGIRRGEDVEQGDVIGYVGNTGLSTGPHLHLGVRLDGEPIDPQSLESTRGAALSGDDLAAFEEVAQRWGRELDAIEIEEVDLSAISLESREDDETLANDFDVENEDETYE